MTCMLATVHHDPDGRLRDQTLRVMPLLLQLFPAITVHATSTTLNSSLVPLQEAGALIRHAPPVGHAMLGRARRGAIEFALQCNSEHILFCDLDRMLHWAECYPAELMQAVTRVQQADFTVIGRTERAFASHPCTQRDTEVIVNQVFAQVSGKQWDVTAAARGLSREAAQALVTGCSEESVGTDPAWPLFLLHAGTFELAYLATEGMEFETPDRFGDQVAELGSVQAWVDRLDCDVREWALRLEVARCEVAAMVKYS
jgi:hypothetical protein